VVTLVNRGIAELRVIVALVATAVPQVILVYLAIVVILVFLATAVLVATAVFQATQVFQATVGTQV
jgi:hypothetical protein